MLDNHGALRPYAHALSSRPERPSPESAIARVKHIVQQTHLETRASPMAQSTTQIRSPDSTRLLVSAAFALLVLGACSQQAAPPVDPPVAAATAPISSVDAEYLHGGWEADIGSDRVTVAFNREGTWTYDTGCNDPVSSGTFAIQEGELVILEFGEQLESETCAGTLQATYERFTAVLRNFDSADLDEDLLTLTAGEDSISLSRISLS